MPSIRYAITIGGKYVTIPPSDESQIRLTDSVALALKFVTCERAKQVALTIKDRFSSPLAIATLTISI
jgi:hypothetical protein